MNLKFPTVSLSSKFVELAVESFLYSEALCGSAIAFVC